MNRLTHKPTQPRLSCLLLLLMITASLCHAQNDAPIISSLDLLTTPTAGQSATVLWAGIPDVTPQSATVIFTVVRPDGSREKLAAQPMAMMAGEVCETKCSVNFAVPGLYKIYATAEMKVNAGQFADAAMLALEVPAQGPAKRVGEPVVCVTASPENQSTENPAPPARAASYLTPFNVTGVFHYTDGSLDASGNFIATGLKPIRFAEVHIWRLLPSGYKSDRLTVYTDANGRFTGRLSSIHPGDKLFFVIWSDSNAVRVTDPNRVYYTYQTVDSVPMMGGDFDAGTFAVADSRPWNILDAVIDGNLFAKLNLGVPRKVYVRWAPGYTENKYYWPSVGPTIQLSGASVDPNEYDDSEILRLYANFLIDTFSYVKYATGDYGNWNAATSPEVAWYFGWSYFFSCAARNTPLYLDAKAGSATVLNIELPTNQAKGEKAPGAIAAVLWDIYDNVDDGLDTLSDPENGKRLCHIFDYYFNSGYGVKCTMETFYKGWESNYRDIYPDKVKLILLAHGMNYWGAPTVTLNINSGGARTANRNVTLNNVCSMLPAYYTAIESNTSVAPALPANAVWTAYHAAPSFRLSSGNGVKTVWIWVKDQGGFVSQYPGSDTITLDETIPLQLNGYSATGSISSASDVDKFSFTVTRTNLYTIETWAGTLSDNFMQLYGPNSQTSLQAQDDDTGSGAMAKITRTLTPGTYYVKITGKSGRTGSYKIRATNASLLVMSNLGYQYSGTLKTGSDENWFQFTVNSSATCTIKTLAGTLKDAKLYLYNINNPGALVDFNDDASATNLMPTVKRALTAGIYLVKITGKGGLTGNYKITLAQ